MSETPTDWPQALSRQSYDDDVSGTPIIYYAKPFFVPVVKSAKVKTMVE